AHIMPGLENYSGKWSVLEYPHLRLPLDQDEFLWRGPLARHMLSWEPSTRAMGRWVWGTPPHPEIFLLLRFGIIASLQLVGLCKRQSSAHIIRSTEESLGRTSPSRRRRSANHYQPSP